MPQSQTFPIVAIGASAGGLTPLEAVLGGLPREPTMGVVVVTHLNPDRPSVLPEILARATWMEVVKAEHGQTVEAGRVHVMPPGAILTIRDGRLIIRRPNAERRERNPIDIFFGALATDAGDRAIGIVLSGAGSDGALGLKAIKEHGGITMAQGADHSAPGHSGMPDSAVATGMVDLLLPVEAMAPKLAELASSMLLEALAIPEASESEPEQLDEARRTICGIVTKQVGHDFSGYKPSTFLRRVRRRMQILHLISLAAFIERLRRDPDEVAALFHDLLINVTDFFRDADAFEALTHHIPRLLDGKGADETVRVWIPGCATGEEVYSIAILFREAQEAMETPPKVQIFATDIDEAALGVARSGRYPAALLEKVSEERLERYFVNDGGSYSITREVREICIFSAHSLVRDPPFSRIDMISCRNLLIYLGSELQNRVVPLFHYALCPGGLLFLGSAENVSQHPDLFNAIDKKHRIFERAEKAPGAIGFPLYVAGGPMPSVVADRPVPRSEQAIRSVRSMAEARVLERHAPAFVIVDADNEIIHFSGRTGRYLEAPTGAPTRHLPSLARKGLRLDLGIALNEARQAGHAVTRNDLSIELDDRVQFFDLTVEPLREQGGDSLCLVLFAETGEPVAADQVAVRGLRCFQGDEEAVQHLEHELRETRERLQSLVEEYETAIEELKSSNEELVSMNEELQSTSEELETAKEEQQSVNEELHTVNIELHRKVEELDRANADMRNLFASTRIATVFLDRGLLIRSFTPDAGSIFNLIGSDIGRPLTDISNRLAYARLKEDIYKVFETGDPLERAVASAVSEERRKIHYLARLRPYRDREGQVEGIVATFVDVTQLVEAEEHQRLLVAELNHRVKNMLAIVMALSTQTAGTADDVAGFVEVFQARLHAMARTFELLSRRRWSDVDIRQIMEEALQPFAGDRLHLEGPPLVLHPKAALSIGMVLHELVTNAVKYGALSSSNGILKVDWRAVGGDDAPRVEISWIEHDGPAVTVPHREGFGSQLVKGEVFYTLQGDVKLDFASDGLRVNISFPADPLLVGIAHATAPARDDVRAEEQGATEDR